MDPESRPDIVFQQSLFKREALMDKWPQLRRVITSADEVAAAYEVAERHPMWREDPMLVDIPRATVNEVLKLYNAVVADGRYIAEFQTNPAGVARKLKVKVSKQAVGVVSHVHKKMKSDVGVVGAAVVVSVAVVGAAVTTAIISSHADRRDRILVDDSGYVKLGSDQKKKRPGNKKKKSKKTKKTKKHA